jgi:hypothetical protein
MESTENTEDEVLQQVESENIFLDRMTESERSGERLLQAARRVSAANQLTE